MADIPSKIQTVYQRIQKERKMIEGFRAMAAATGNYDVRASCEAKIRESEKTIQWFEQSLRELQKKQQGGAPGANSDAASVASAGSSGSAVSSSPYGGGARPSASASTSSSAISAYSRSESSTSTATQGTSVSSSHRNRVLPPTPGSLGATIEDSDRSLSMHAQGLPQPAFRDNGAAGLSIRRRGGYTNLDLIKYETPLNSAKISKMLNQLEFKLRVEKEYMHGIEKMAKLYQVEGDKKARSDAEAKRIESKGKKDLLEAALKRYKTLDIMGGVFDEDEGADDDGQGLNRRPVSGTLQITIKSARDLDHLPTNRRKPTETVVVVKVEDTPRARTYPSRTDRWNEDFELHVDKANEVEVTIYDKPPGTNETPTPIGMLWIRLSDVVDELRRKKVGAEAGAGWVTAAGVEGGSNITPPGTGQMGHRPTGSIGGLDAPVAAQLPPNAQSAAMRPGTAVDGIDAWFSVEPAGQIDLHLNFVKTNVRKRPYDAGGLGRQGAVRKRKEEVLEQNGHKFIQKQFYGVVLCAFCQEFLLKGLGMQCEDCRYTCHKKCYDKVVTKCVSKSNADMDKDGDKINHRIPHRFEPITTLSPSWCCHCGQIVPLSRKKARKCTECGLSCHVDCAHLVPDFCGMSMEMARQLIGDIRSINKTRTAQHGHQPSSMSALPPIPGPPGRQQPPSSPASSRVPLSSQQQQDLVEGTGRMQIDPSRRPLPPTMPQQVQQQQQAQTPPHMKYPLPGGQQTASPAQQPPAMQRPPSSGPPSMGGREQYPLPAGASLQQRQSYQDLPPGAAGPPSSGSFADPSQYAQRPPQQAPHPQQRPGPPPSQQRPFSDYQQQQMQGPRPMGAQPPQMPSSAPAQHQVLSLQELQRQTQQAQAQAQAQSQAPHQPMQIDTRQSPHTSPQKPTGPQQRQSFNQNQYPLPGGAQQMPPTPTKSRPPQQQQQSQQQIAKPRKVGLDDFNFLAVLGKGNFGKVMLAEEKKTNKQWAIKVLKKEFIIENDEIESTRSEKRVFLAAAREQHPFLLDLHSCFQTETRIYFVMEYIQGGDLMMHIQKGPFTQRRARYYAAEVLLALEYLHRQGIIYRDLKLDNILLTLDGHVKVADYGLCKENMGYGATTSTFCGTPEFMAPEILLNQPYGRAVDWWAFGVLIYEMLLTQSPFRGDDEDEIFDAILEDELLYPIHMPHASVSILQQLLTRNPAQRLGAGPDDAEPIKRHAFFKDINWDDIMAKRIPAPYIPQTSGPLDISNFDSEFTSEQPTLTPVHSQLSAQDQREFRDFSWIGPAGMQA